MQRLTIDLMKVLTLEPRVMSPPVTLSGLLF